MPVQLVSSHLLELELISGSAAVHGLLIRGSHQYIIRVASGKHGSVRSRIEEVRLTVTLCSNATEINLPCSNSYSMCPSCFSLFRLRSSARRA